jgi:hypothetical protein
MDKGGKIMAGEEKQEQVSTDIYTAAIVDYKLKEFVRLDLPGLIGGAGAGPFFAPGAPPAPPGAPPNWWEILKAIENLVNWKTEINKIKGKIQNILDALAPKPAGGGEVLKPLRPIPRQLTDLLQVLDAAREAAENLEPDSARDSLKEAKGMMHDEAVKQVFRDLGAGKSWYDILMEMQQAIGFLDCVARTR